MGAKPRTETLRCRGSKNGIHNSTRYKCLRCNHHHCVSENECAVCYCDGYMPNKDRVYYPNDAEKLRQGKELPPF